MSVFVMCFINNQLNVEMIFLGGSGLRISLHPHGRVNTGWRFSLNRSCLPFSTSDRLNKEGEDYSCCNKNNKVTRFGPDNGTGDVVGIM